MTPESATTSETPSSRGAPSPGWRIWRVAIALLVAALIVAAALTGLAWLAASLEFASRAAAFAEARRAAVALFVALPFYALTVGLAGVLLLDRLLGRRGWGAFALAGMALGAAAAAVQAQLVPAAGGGGPLTWIVAGGVSAVVFLLARLLLGPGRR